MEASERSARPILSTLARLSPILLLVLLAVVLGRQLDDLRIEDLRLHEAELRQSIAERPVLVVGGFVALYAGATAAFLPVGIVLMLGAGFLLGPWLGAAACVAGNTGGALIAYLAARYSGRSLHRRAQAGRLGPFIDGFGRNAFAYMLALRLLPFSPFGLVNLAAGVARAPIRPFLAATVVGAIPTCLIYTHLGAGLGTVFRAGRAPDVSIMTEPRIFVPLLCLAALSLGGALISRRRHRSG